MNEINDILLKLGLSQEDIDTESNLLVNVLPGGIQEVQQSEHGPLAMLGEKMVLGSQTTVPAFSAIYQSIVMGEGYINPLPVPEILDHAARAMIVHVLQRESYAGQLEAAIRAGISIHSYTLPLN